MPCRSNRKKQRFHTGNKTGNKSGTAHTTYNRKREEGTGRNGSPCYAEAVSSRAVSLC